MGLDDVELLLALEGDLCLDAMALDVGAVRTVGDLYEVLLAALDLRREPVCVTSRAFYRLRRALMSVTGCPRAAVKPHAPLAALLPWGRRRRAWAAIREASGLPLPVLGRPRGVIYMLWGVWALVTTRMILALVGPGDPINFTMVATAAALAGMVGALAVCVLWLPTGRLATDFPAGVQSVADLVHRLQRRVPGEPSPPAALDTSAVWDVLTAHVARITRVPVEAIGRDTRFAEDLGF